MLDDGLPEGRDEDMEQAETEESVADGSLSEDIATLIDDGRTYVEAEIAFQSARLAFAADRGKSGLLFGVFAIAVLHLALVALVVGAIFALTPLITAMGATALVTGLLILAGLILAAKAKSHFARLAKSFEKAKE